MPRFYTVTKISPQQETGRHTISLYCLLNWAASAIASIIYIGLCYELHNMQKLWSHGHIHTYLPHFKNLANYTISNMLFWIVISLTNLKYVF